ncbi:MAG: chaperone NapD [Magnetospirillum sp.]|nr:chaperone NapD [Magnetospirillum sp.]
MRLGTFVEHEHQAMRPTVENICGVLVHVVPARRQQIRAELEARPGVEVHTMTDDGKLVVVVEDAEGQWAGSIITSFHDIDGVLSVALVYHHFDKDLEGEIVP